MKAESVDPELFVAELESRGWRLVGRRDGIYCRLVPPDVNSERHSNVIVPLDRNAADFADQMSAALKAVRLEGG